MNFKQLLIIAFFLLIGNTFLAQNYTISGTITDASTKETAVGATVYIKETNKGTSTNEKGFYQLSMPKGNYTLVISYIGFNTIEIPIELNKNLKINQKIEPTVITAEEFTVVGEKENENTDDAVMSTVELKMDKVKTLPAIFGEVDVLKTVQLMPGVQTAG
ncbi:MAG TPA: carboxypeptidase-like regulatory domain-containing protein, partial [Vicingaceae bacterium]|nr:carboxypeptidase-like regulatory domain-containing protein [Vicingaceae bacterium]